MKNKIITLLLTLASFNYICSKPLEIVDCEQYAADMLNVIENYLGCLYSDTYNETYDGLLIFCESMNQ